MRSILVQGLGLACILLMGASLIVEAQARSEPPKGGSVDASKAPGKPGKGTKEGVNADASAGKDSGDRGVNKSRAAVKPEKTAYDYELPGADGKALKMSTFKDKVVLIVNLGRGSSYNAQLPALQKLSETYKAKGLVVIGVPSNEFGAAEPGTDAEIQKSYAEAKVTFTVTPVSSLTGVQELPLFAYLTKGKTVPPGGAVHWNYTKFLIDRQGKVVARFEPDAAPDSPEMLTTVDQVIRGSFKPHKDEPKDEAGGDENDDGP